ncbi:MAG: beta-galactosidase trimerization domain-containing protein [Chloroflexota bacterium]|nr:beta-galactosidase trimerization domain-containing protein [Chloroflexota bacterium]
MTTYFSGVVDETDLAFEGYPGPLSKVLGIRVEEIDALYEGQTNQIVMADGSGSYTCARLCDIIHSEGAHVYATYGSDFYAGTPAVTEHHYGNGWAYYLASDPEERFLDAFYKRLLAAYSLTPLLATPAGVEVTLRQTERQELLFILNHNPTEAKVELPASVRYTDLLSGQDATGSLTLAGYDVSILATERG